MKIKLRPTLTAKQAEERKVEREMAAAARAVSRSERDALRADLRFISLFPSMATQAEIDSVLSRSEGYLSDKAIEALRSCGDESSKREAAVEAISSMSRSTKKYDGLVPIDGIDGV